MFFARHNRKVYFNPRSLHGERQTSALAMGFCSIFQSTLPARGATGPHSTNKNAISFQSTLPARGATSQLRECGNGAQNFNPRSLHGERQKARLWRWAGTIFQSTLPARGATCRACAAEIMDGFQSTLPARGATCVLHCARNKAVFQSTLPARGATLFRFHLLLVGVISIHAPCTGSDLWRKF